MILGNSRTDLPLIKRLRTSMRPSLSLKTLQVLTITQFRESVRDGNYSFSANPCLCGAKDDTIVGFRDRYGLDVRTVLCRSCGLLRTDPYLDQESLARFYEFHYQPIYTGVTQTPPEFFDAQMVHGKEIIRALQDTGIPLPGCVLEIGCGAGGILEAFRQRGVRVAGCDLGGSFLDYGRQKGLSLEHSAMEGLRKYAPADLVILSHVVEHFRDPVGELQKTCPLLTSDGYLYVEVPGLFWIENSYDGDFGRYLQNAHVYHFCLESLDYVMSLSGFSRFAGNEKVTAFYSRGDVSPLCPQNLATKTVRYLRRLERRRSYRIFRSYIKRLLSFLGHCTIMSIFRQFSKKFE